MLDWLGILSVGKMGGDKMKATSKRQVKERDGVSFRVITIRFVRHG
jgi:hypothetical protein